MKLGFRLRREHIRMEHILRKMLIFLSYIVWLLFSPSKFCSIKQSEIKNILVIDSAGVGDIVNSLGVANSFKQQYPKVNIFFFTKDSAADIARGNPSLKGVETDLGRLLKSEKIDLTFVLGMKSEDRKIITKMKHVVHIEPDGISDAINLDGFFSMRRKFPKTRHWIRRRLDCFELAGFKVPPNLTFFSDEKDKQKAAAFFKNINPQNKKIILLNPESARFKKMREQGLLPTSDWSAKNWSALAERFVKEYDSLVLFTGAKEDQAQIKKIISLVKDKKKILSIAGNFSVREMGEFMKLCDLLVSIDTGTVHIGAQVGIPVIDLLGPYNPKLYCAWNPASSLEESKAISLFYPKPCCNCRRLSCPEGNNICIKSITVEDILKISKSFIKEKT